MDGTEQPVLRKRLFGYSRSAVDQLIFDRDSMLHQAEERVRSAQTKSAEAETHLAKLQDENERLGQQLEELRAEHAAADVGARPSDDPAAQVTSAFLADELASILTAAEESARRIVDRARNSSEQQMAEADRMWREAQAQIARFAAWRDRAEPTIRSAHARLDDVRQRIEDVPGQIRSALSPLADAIAALDTDLVEVSTVASPPLLVAPSGLDLHPPGASQASERTGEHGSSTEGADYQETGTEGRGSEF